MKALLRTPQARAVLAILMAAYLRFALRTTRWTMSGAEHYQPFAAGQPVIFAFWHEFLPAAPAIVRFRASLPGYRWTQLYTLVSQHRDGRLIGEIVRRLGIMPVHGSSSRGGAAGLRNLATALRDGGQIGITPDGPRGPRRQAAPGMAQLAALAGVPVVPCAARTKFALQFNTWDRMRIPLPFGRGTMVIGPAITVSRQEWQGSVPLLAAALNDVATRAEAWCGA